MDCRVKPGMTSGDNSLIFGKIRRRRHAPPLRQLLFDECVLRWEFERGGIEVDIDVTGPLTLNDQDLMVDAALDGAGLAYVFEAQVDDLIARRKLIRVLADWCPAYPGFFLYYPSRRQLPAALRAFVDFARSSFFASPPVGEAAAHAAKRNAVRVRGEASRQTRS